MTKIINLLSKVLILSLIVGFSSCRHHHHDHHHHHAHIDERYPFLGTYHASETFINAQSGIQETYTYDIEIREANGSDVEILVTGYGNGGIYGTNCSLIGNVYGGSHIDIPLNICHYDNNTTFEITGHGELFDNGYHLTFDLDIIRCDGPTCVDQPHVSIHAHRI